MSDALTLLKNACNPLEPALPEHFVDCSCVRGGDALVSLFRNDLAGTETGKYLRFLFSGHIGGGKSSELRHLAQALDTPRPSAPHKRFLPIVLDASEYVDDYDVAPSDLLLAIVAELAATLRESGIGELKDNYFQRRIQELKNFLLSDVEIQEGEIPLWDAKVKIQRLKKDPTAREGVRKYLQPKMTTVLSEINTVFDEARILLAKKNPGKGEAPYIDFVLILDNLEKIERLANSTEGDISKRKLFIECAPQLLSPTAHVIYTVPLTLVRSHGPQLKEIYGAVPYVLPMVKVIRKDGRTPNEEGIARLREILQKRAGNAPLDSLFEKEALDWLFKYSGGHIRSLMHFSRTAISYAVGEQIVRLRAVQRAIAQTAGLYSTSIPTAHWEKLAQLDQSPDKSIRNDDPDFQRMLEQITVLEYIDGEAECDPFAELKPWYAVNPIVRELSEFKAALKPDMFSTG